MKLYSVFCSLISVSFAVSYKRKKEDLLKNVVHHGCSRKAAKIRVQSRAFAKLTYSRRFFFHARETKIEKPTNWPACRKKLMNAFTHSVHLIQLTRIKKEKSKKEAGHSRHLYCERFIRGYEISKANFRVILSSAQLLFPRVSFNIS